MIIITPQMLGVAIMSIAVILAFILGLTFHSCFSEKKGSCKE